MIESPRDGIGRFQGALDVTLDLPLAGVGSRAVAHAIDLAVVFLVLVLVLTGFTLSLSALSDEQRSLALAGLIILNFLIFWGYFVACELLMQGQSPGKRLLGLRVVGRDGAAVDALGSLVRNLLRYADFIPGFYGVGVIAMLASARSQRLGDLAAGTVVVRESTAAERRPVRWPEALAAADIALLEAWVLRAPHLLPDRRLALAGGLARWLERAYPALAGALDPSLPTERALEALIEGWRAPA